MATSTSSKIPITILGAGITGLAIAYHLSSSPLLANKYEITLIARDLPGDLGLGWASPWAGAIFQPQPTPNPLHQHMQKTSFAFYHALALTNPPSETGVKIYPCTEYFDAESLTSSTPDVANSSIHSLMPDFRVLLPSELPVDRNGITSGVAYTSLAINPSLFLPWIRKQLETLGVVFVRKEVASFQELRDLTGKRPRIVVNATGVGAKELAGDENVRAIRGQTIFVKSTWEELVIREGTEYTYIIPRPGSGGVILGGVKGVERDTRKEGDMGVREDILRRVNLLTGGAFEGSELVVGGEGMDIVGFRPGRVGGMRVEVERGEDGKVAVVHAYGMGGAGYIYSFGVAERVGELIAEMVVEMGLLGEGNDV